MATARDIALIFLSLEALIGALIPLALLSALAYALYRLIPLVRAYLRLALSYAERLREAVDRLSRRVVAPLIWLYCTLRRIQVMFQNLLPGRSL
ncbi:MAG: hypothetical protein ACP5HM_14130 [Anaerolineae bacterium]